jgi:hypothetical protein
MLFSCSPEGRYQYGNPKARYQSGLFSKAYLPDENKFVVTRGKTSRLDKGASEEIKRICFGVFIERSLPIR